MVVAALLLAVAYQNSFSGPFLGDGIVGIAQNPTIRHLWPLRVPLSPPPATTASGRPLLNLTFALNYAISGLSPWSYHATNLAIHVLAALTLFGVLRRTLRRPLLPERIRLGAEPIAFAAALLWMLHPVQTTSVTYVVQRAESMMGLCYLLTLYAFIRAMEVPGRHGRWLGASVLALLLGIASKEVAVTAPLLVLLYDRTFVAGSFGTAWRNRWKYYLALSATWLVLAPEALAGRRDPTSGFGNGLSLFAYARTQFRAVVHYLTVAVWPHSLRVYYFEPDAGAKHFASVPTMPYAWFVIPLLVATLWALRRPGAMGFLGAWFFGILVPTSLVPGVLDTMADRRIYLSLAAVAAGAVAGLWLWLGRHSLWLWSAAAVALAVATARRNAVYASDFSLCQDQVAGAPDDPVARYNLGCAFTRMHRTADAISEYRQALLLDPGYVEAMTNLGAASLETGDVAGAIRCLQESVRLAPGHLSARVNLASALMAAGQLPAAITQLDAALASDPSLPQARYLLGIARQQRGNGN